MDKYNTIEVNFGDQFLFYFISTDSNSYILLYDPRDWWGAVVSAQ